MIDRESQNDACARTIDIDMSKEAIAQRIRDASELNELGISLAKARPRSSPKVPIQIDAPKETSQVLQGEPSAEK